jgi:hypothetical protein
MPLGRVVTVVKLPAFQSVAVWILIYLRPLGVQRGKLALLEGWSDWSAMEGAE